MTIVESQQRVALDPVPDVPEARPASGLLEVSRATLQDWQRAIGSATRSVPEQSPEWVAAMCEARGVADVSRAYRFVDGRIAVLPLVRRGMGRLASWWSPLPAWGVGGLVGAADAATVRAVVEDLRRLPAARVAVRIDEIDEPLWFAASGPGDVVLERCVHVIDMAPTLDEQFQLLNKTTRRLVRRAAKGGVEVRVDRRGELIDNHYALYLRSVERWAAKQHEPVQLALARARRRDPIEKLRLMQQALGERCIVVASFVDGAPASSSIVLLGDTTRDTRGALDPDVAGSSGANEAMQWRAIEEAHEFGSGRYHLGESGTSVGLATFKEKFGATARRHHEYRFERLPVTRTTTAAKNVVKRAIGFED